MVWLICVAGVAVDGRGGYGTGVVLVVVVLFFVVDVGIHSRCCCFWTLATLWVMGTLNILHTSDRSFPQLMV